jgi:glutathione S-transferase
MRLAPLKRQLKSLRVVSGFLPTYFTFSTSSSKPITTQFSYYSVSSSLLLTLPPSVHIAMAEAQEPQAATSKPKVTLHWLERSRSHRILWLLEELNVDYDLKTYKRLPTMLAPDELKEVHPLGKSPVIGVQGPGQSKPRVIAESALIVEYISDHFGENLIPKRWPEGKEKQLGEETEAWLRYRYFMHYAEGSLMYVWIFPQPHICPGQFGGWSRSRGSKSLYLVNLEIQCSSSLTNNFYRPLMLIALFTDRKCSPSLS